MMMMEIVVVDRDLNMSLPYETMLINVDDISSVRKVPKWNGNGYEWHDRECFLYFRSGQSVTVAKSYDDFKRQLLESQVNSIMFSQ